MHVNDCQHRAGQHCLMDASPEPLRSSGCAASTDTARITRTGSVSHHPIAVQGGETMNKSELTAQVAAERSATRAEAERMVEAVISAVGDALARGEPVAARGLRSSPSTAAPRERAAIRRPGTLSTSPPPGRRRLRPRRPFETRSTPDVAHSAARYRSRPTTFGAERRRTESHPYPKRANMPADHARTLDACGVDTPYRRR